MCENKLGPQLLLDDASATPGSLRKEMKVAQAPLPRARKYPHLQPLDRRPIAPPWAMGRMIFPMVD
jgi:hypothetical protein